MAAPGQPARRAGRRQRRHLQAEREGGLGDEQGAALTGGALVAHPGVRGRAWVYDSAVTATALVRDGDPDGAGALLDRLQQLQRPDGALESSYDLATLEGEGPLRTGNQAWVGIAALTWRAATGSRRHDALVAGVERWLLERWTADDLLCGGPDVDWVSTEHNLEARAFFAAAGDRGRGRVDRLDRAIGAELLAGDRFRQGLGDDALPLDVQALGILWLLCLGRRSEAAAVAAFADAAMRVSGRELRGHAFTGYRPYADAGGPDVLWFEGTLMMRLAHALLGSDTAELDDSIRRWVALTAPGPPLQADREWGPEYRPWPAAAPAAWLRLARSCAA